MVARDPRTRPNNLVCGLRLEPTQSSFLILLISNSFVVVLVCFSLSRQNFTLHFLSLQNCTLYFLMPNTLVKNLAKNLVKNLAKNPDELEMNTPQIWSKTWVPGRIRTELWVCVCLVNALFLTPYSFNRLHKAMLDSI